MTTQIQVKRDTAANWTAADPVLSAGEFGYVTDTGEVKVGDGSTAWSALTALGAGGGGGGGGGGERHYARIPAELVINSPTPVTDTVVPGMSLIIPSAAVARVAFVSFLIRWTGHNMRTSVYLNGVSAVDYAFVFGAEEGYVCSVSLLPVVLSSGSAHTIDVQWNSVGSTGSITVKERSLVVDVLTGSTSPLTL